MKEMTFVETQRLILRKVREEDFEGYFRDYLMDKEMDRMMCRNPTDNEEEAQLGFDWFLNKEERAYVIVHKGSGKVIGNLTVYNSPPPIISDRGELAGRIGRSLSFAMSRNWQRKGLMFEAVSSVIDHIFQKENVDFINCGYLSYNEASKGLQRKLGFSYLCTEQFPFGDQEITSVENILWRTE